jgi:hypothetical protein
VQPVKGRSDVGLLKDYQKVFFEKTCIVSLYNRKGASAPPDPDLPPGKLFL